VTTPTLIRTNWWAVAAFTNATLAAGFAVLALTGGGGGAVLIGVTFFVSAIVCALVANKAGRDR
jgi:hypothetical protein